MQAWQRTDERNALTRAGYRTVEHKQFQMNNGSSMQADIVDEPGLEAACVIALTPENKVIVARQFRCGPEKILDELPGGVVDKGETPHEAAHREMIEEVGYTSDTITEIGKAHVNAWSNAMHYYFLATNCTPLASNNPEAAEEIEVDAISITDLIDNAKNARMTDVQAVFFAYDTLKAMEGST